MVLRGTSKTGQKQCVIEVPVPFLEHTGVSRQLININIPGSHLCCSYPSSGTMAPQFHHAYLVLVVAESFTPSPA